MRVHPVIDVKGGLAVAARGGLRERYAPLESPLVAGSDPVAAAEAFRSKLGLTSLYLADLDAIEGAAPALELYRGLAGRGFRLLVDRGVRRAEEAEAVIAAGAEAAVCALETAAAPELAAECVERLGPDRVVFSLDLRGGKPVAPAGGWPETPQEIARAAVRAGIRRMILLDLEAVGEERGPAVLPLLEELRARFPHVEYIAGGGVRGPDDVRALRRAGAAGVLVATAFHTGAIDRAALETLMRGQEGGEGA